MVSTLSDTLEMYVNSYEQQHVKPGHHTFFQGHPSGASKSISAQRFKEVQYKPF